MEITTFVSKQEGEIYKSRRAGAIGSIVVLLGSNTLPVKHRHQPTMSRFYSFHTLSADEHKHSPARMCYSKFVHYV